MFSKRRNDSSKHTVYCAGDLENKSRVSGKKMKECSVWAFGYGSIIWKVDFPTTESCVGYVRGFVRRFYQGSTDHRGTPESPGRVVTLLPTGIEEDKVWGVAYRIPDEEVESVISHLDYREKGGFTRSKTLFFPKDSKARPHWTKSPVPSPFLVGPPAPMLSICSIFANL
ncbi:putative glutathione-specific gamma-glutamylcyclotransferase 2 isoform X5 [Varroa jacobsoni]|uniref:putative glutathione-specific gamma-glutamylcyclotransferase 2 isoform X5 n=1 Tax=Varroa jacobsoni TaxID=62625 RepID=UPI000BFA2176|nr:putative glutathione-specific gamma-glutamylcyclotransferase 2 isoform X5 [Varroa jacobsoni]